MPSPRKPRAQTVAASHGKSGPPDWSQWLGDGCAALNQPFSWDHHLTVVLPPPTASLRVSECCVSFHWYISTDVSNHAPTGCWPFVRSNVNAPPLHVG
eukprot:6964745-Prymnesium_polylepis.1